MQTLPFVKADQHAPLQFDIPEILDQIRRTHEGRLPPSAAIGS
jgi:hypothetical protein